MKLEVNTTTQNKPEISVAPMMDLTDHHCRYFLRLISPNSLLYTEMVTANAIIFGDKSRLLEYNTEEHPLALQVAGCDPNALAQSVKIANQFGFDEINLNVGCPSDRVQKAKIGACLMAEPDLVADCIKAMLDVSDVPISIKTRIGIDNQDSYQFLQDFIEKNTAIGCRKFIIHARKAWLNGLNPKQNRTVPQLDYERVYQVKKDYPDLQIILNGGIETVSDVQQALPFVDGVMIGRAAYYNPYLLAELEKEVFDNSDIKSRYEVLDELHNYLSLNLEKGVPWIKMARHYMGLFKGQAGARAWRQFLSETRDINQQNLADKLKAIKNLLISQQEALALREAS